MALYYELPVYNDTYKLILMIFEYTKDFSREYKYTLGQDMKRDALQLVRGIYRANKAAKKDISLYSDGKTTYANIFNTCGNPFGYKFAPRIISGDLNIYRATWKYNGVGGRYPNRISIMKR